MAFTPDQATPMIDEPIRPRSLWYWIGAGVITAGTAGAIVAFVLSITGFDDKTEGFERVSYPEGGTVQLEAGEYVIYGEEQFSFGSTFVTAEIDLTDPNGDSVDTRRYVNSLTYDFGGRSGTAIATFSADESGEYEFAPVVDPLSDVSDLAVGDSIGDDLAKIFIYPMLIGSLSLLIGAIILIVTGVRRSRAKRARRPTTPPPSNWGQGPQTWGPQPQAQPGWGQAPPPAQPGWGQPPPPGRQPAPPPQPSRGAPNPPPPPGWPS